MPSLENTFKLIHAMIETESTESFHDLLSRYDLDNITPEELRHELRILEETAVIHNTAATESIRDLIGISNKQLENPNQITFDEVYSHEIIVSQGIKDPESRMITVNKHDQHGEVLPFVYGVDNWKTISKYKGQTERLFTYTLSRLAASPDNTTTFSLNDIVESGMYSHINNAKRAIDTAKHFLTSIKFDDDGVLKVLFPTFGVRYRTSIVEVEVHKDFSLIEGGEFYARMPKAIWKININAYLIASMIFLDFRNNAKQINPKSRYFKRKISLPHIIDRLDLPSDTHRIRQLIIKPIEDAIKEINDNKDLYLTLELCIDYQQPPQKQIKDGYIEYTIHSSPILQYGKDISQKRINAYTAKQEKKEKLEIKEAQAKGRQKARIEAQKKKESLHKND